MKIEKLDDQYAVSGQVSPEDVERIAQLGFTTLINNRPDNETEDQPSSDQLGAAAKANGMDYYYLPVVPNQLSPETVAQLDRILNESRGPVFAFCRTGNRSTQAWKLRNQLSPQGPDQTSGDL